MTAQVSTDNMAIWLNPAVLKWAREWRGRTIEQAAARVGKDPSAILDWEAGKGAPTLAQARKLAHLYDRPFLEFFLPEPPEVPLPALVPDYRLDSRPKTQNDERELREIQQWAETQRENALDLFAEVGSEPPGFPQELFCRLSDRPSDIASRVRTRLQFPVQEQISMTKKEAEKLPSILRTKFEAAGALTLKRTDMKALGVRGICLAEFPLPVIVFRNESPSAQAFTLVHEFGHILLRESGITGARVSQYEKQPVERWCDRFAASFLMPQEQVAAIVGARPSVPAPSISDTELHRLASIFRVSPHAMLIRLVHLDYVQRDYYWSVKKPAFDKEEDEYSGGGRSSYYGSRYKSSLGDLYTGLVIEAWSSGRITNHNAAEFMGIKRLSHLFDIRENFGR